MTQRYGWIDCEHLGKRDDGDYVLHADAERAVGESRSQLVKAQESLARFESQRPELGDLSFRERLRSALITNTLQENENLRALVETMAKAAQTAYDLIHEEAPGYTGTLHELESAIFAAERYLAPEQAEQKGERKG